MGERPVVVAGAVSGLALVLDEPLSLWGGLDPATGTIIDQHHPQTGQSVTGKVLVLPSGRGSSGGSSVLAESVRAGVGPAAVILAVPDPILVVGGVVLAELYPDQAIPIVVADPSAFADLRTGATVSIDENGRISGS